MVTWEESERLKLKKTTSVVQLLASCAAISFPLSSNPFSINLYPLLAKDLAIFKPMPLVPPVINAVFFIKQFTGFLL